MINWIQIGKKVHPDYGEIVLLYMKGRDPVVGFLDATDRNGHHFKTCLDGEFLIESPTHYAEINRPTE